MLLITPVESEVIQAALEIAAEQCYADMETIEDALDIIKAVNEQDARANMEKLLDD